MALAILTYHGSLGGKHRFRFKLGSNRYFQAFIGSNETYRRHGVTLMSRIKDQTEIIGPVGPGNHGEGELNIPMDQFDEEHQNVQLVSFKNTEGVGPVASEIVRVLPTTASPQLPDRMMVPAFSQNGSKMKNAKNTPRKVKEVAYTEAMFLDVLLKALPLVKEFVGAIPTKKASSGETQADVGALLKDPKKLEDLTALLQDLMARGNTQSSSAGLSGAKANYSTAMNPLIMMIPQLLKAVADLGKIGAQINKDELDALKDLNPGVDDPDIQALLKDMSVGLMRDIPKIAFKNIDRVQITPHSLVTHSVHGKDQYYFKYGQEIGIPLSIETPKTLPEGVVQFIALSQDNEVAFEHKTKFFGGEGMIAQVPTIPASKTDDLIPGKNYRLLVCVVWKGKSGNKLGAEMSLPIGISKACIFDRLEDAGEVLHLPDAVSQRAFWHRSWKGEFNEDAKRFEFQFTYYYKVDGHLDENARIPTELALKPDRPNKMVGKIRSGMIFSLEVLNELIPPSYPRLTPQELECLAVKDFTNVLQFAARAHFQLKGKEQSVASLYAIPEFSLRTIVLKKPGVTSSNGNITSFQEVSTVFPVPQAAILKVTQSGVENAGDEQLNGLPVVEDQRIPLEPVNLIYKEHEYTHHGKGRL